MVLILQGEPRHLLGDYHIDRPFFEGLRNTDEKAVGPRQAFHRLVLTAFHRLPYDAHKANIACGRHALSIYRMQVASAREHC